MEISRKAIDSPWPHRLAVLLALVTFPLIWAGGLVTTYDAGMAVPDWPGTYGYNLFAYPWQTWLAGPWDLFIEHGHRLLGALAGILSIALVAVAFLSRASREIRWLAAGALLLVIVQGVLGGARVLLDERLVAMIHACVGPVFFAYLAGLVVSTSEQQLAPGHESGASALARTAWTAVGLTYIQLVLGAMLRHIPLDASAQLFRAALVLHLALAAFLPLQLGLVAWQAWKTGHRKLARTGLSLPILVMAQIVLGLATYVAKYAWPAWLGDYQFAANFVVQERGLTQSLITTAHVANGSLILFVSALVAMRANRCALMACSPAASIAEIKSINFTASAAA